MKIAVVIPTIKQTTDLDKCIQSIKKHEKDTDYEIVVVDDGSKPVVQNWIEKRFEKDEQVRVFLKKENRGFAHTINYGVRRANGDVIVLVNNDVIFIKPIFKTILNTFKADSEIGVVGAKLLYPPGAKVQHAGVIRLPYAKNAFIHINKGTSRNSPGVNTSKFYISVTGALYAFTRELSDKIGPWNEKYFLSCEDTEYSLRAWQAGFKVFYNHNVEALHHEGLTRGNTDRTKRVKGLDWMIKEKHTLNLFHKEVVKYDMVVIDRKVHAANAAVVPVASKTSRFVNPATDKNIINIEISYGDFFESNVIRVGTYHTQSTDMVVNIDRDRLPFDDKKVESIVVNHMIQKMSFRSIPHFLKECQRVLKPQGRLFIRTPDLRFIIDLYNRKMKSVEHPDDDKFIKEHLTQDGEVSLDWWMNQKLFAGQDSKYNVNNCCLTFEMVQGLLEKYGFEKVERVLKKELSPGELQITSIKKGKVEDVGLPIVIKERILIKRRGALGDVILTTPIVRRFREIYGQEAQIDV